METWSPRFAAFVIGNIDYEPRTYFEQSPAAAPAAKPDWLTTGELSDLQKFMPQLLFNYQALRDRYLAYTGTPVANTARRVYNLWQALDNTPQSMSPLVFLLWCKHRRIRGTATQLKRIERVYRSQLDLDTTVFSDAGKMQKRVGQKLWRLFEDKFAASQRSVKDDDVALYLRAIANKERHHEPDSAIDVAIKATASLDSGPVWAHLEEMAREEKIPFTGRVMYVMKGKSRVKGLVYKKDDGAPYLTKAMLGERLRRRREKLSANRTAAPR
jgi:hypothetical protein